MRNVYVIIRELYVTKWQGVSFMSQKHEYKMKIVMLGDGAVGKTALTVRFSTGMFKEDYSTTIGTDFSVKKLEIPELNAIATLVIYDLAGQPRFAAVRPSFYVGAKGGLLVFDVTRRSSFLNLENWVNEAYNSIGHPIPMLVVANKIDLPDRVVPTHEGIAFAKSHGFLYVESSAKTGENVETAYREIVKDIILKSKNNSL